MIRARVQRPGSEHGPLLVLGIDERNVAALRAGRPIVVELDELLPGVHAELTILYGETLTAIVDKLEEAGLPLPPGERDRVRAIDDDAGSAGGDREGE
jgi:hypothetical protein